jgi:hypothetical protein
MRFSSLQCVPHAPPIWYSSPRLHGRGRRNLEARPLVVWMLRRFIFCIANKLHRAVSNDVSQRRNWDTKSVNCDGDTLNYSFRYIEVLRPWDHTVFLSAKLCKPWSGIHCLVPADDATRSTALSPALQEAPCFIDRRAAAFVHSNRPQRQKLRCELYLLCDLPAISMQTGSLICRCVYSLCERASRGSGMPCSSSLCRPFLKVSGRVCGHVSLLQRH